MWGSVSEVAWGGRPLAFWWCVEKGTWCFLVTLKHGVLDLAGISLERPVKPHLPSVFILCCIGK